jgi:TonB family protein
MSLRCLVLFVCGLFPAAGLAQNSPPYQSEINAFADRLVTDIRAYSQKSGSSPDILVVDFVKANGNINVLGQQIADSLSDALQSRLASSDIVTRQQYRQYLISAGFAPLDLRDKDVLQATAAKAGATLIITGRIFAFKNSTTLQVELVTLPDGKAFSSASTDLTIPLDIKKLLDVPVDWPILPHAVTHCGAGLAAHEAFAAAGVTEPKCIRCNGPAYSDAARHAQWEGLVVLNIMVDEQGRVSSVTVVQGAPYQMDQQAENAVKEWHLQPAMLDGKPVSVCTRVEVRLSLK